LCALPRAPSLRLAVGCIRWIVLRVLGLQRSGVRQMLLGGGWAGVERWLRACGIPFRFFVDGSFRARALWRIRGSSVYDRRTGASPARIWRLRWCEL